MSDYNWCHGPNCHTQETQSRIRGSGDNKVLRTIKIKQGRYNYSGRPELITHDDYFCNQKCLYDFLRLHATAIANLAPRREALETPITVIKEKATNWRGDPCTNIRINKVDNA
tara:strand:+ start:275 stop:613 length:339 start_codon:yes stop_codon:yes gene_type:complete